MAHPIVFTAPVDFEEQALGAALTSEAALDAVLEASLEPDAFSQKRFAVIWKAMVALREADAPVADGGLSVSDYLERARQLDGVGGKQYVVALAGKAPAAGNATFYVSKIVDAWRLRRVHDLGHKLAALSKFNGDCAALSEELLGLLSETANESVSGAQAVPLEEIALEEVRWLWPERVPLAMLTLLIGDPGLGKSLLTVYLAAMVTRAGGDVLLLSAEDHPGATIRPRAEACEADLSRLHIVTMRHEGMEEGLALPDDGAELDRLIEKHKAKLVIVDPLMAHLPESVNSWSDQSMRRALAPLHRSAGAHGCAVVVVAHLNKAHGASPLYRAGGSIGIPAAVRSALLLARDPDDPEPERGGQRILAHVKCNVGPQAESLTGSIETAGQTACFTVTGTSGISASDLLSVPSSEHRTKRDDAEDFLLSELRDDSKTPKELQAAAREAGIGWRTIEDAKAAIGVTSSRTGFGKDGVWRWSLPIDRADIDRSPLISKPAVYADPALESQSQDADQDIQRIDRIDREGTSEPAEIGGRP